MSLLNFNRDADSVEGGEWCDSDARKELQVEREKEKEKETSPCV